MLGSSTIINPGFLSTLSLRRATFLSGSIKFCRVFLSTLSLRRATSKNAAIGKPTFISIHALLAESDLPTGGRTFEINLISIHALLAESDHTGSSWTTWFPNFYPRSPCGERPHSTSQVPTLLDFYPRSPCGERLYPSQWRTLASDFYPRSPCGERQLAACDGFVHAVFLSTLSLRRATR